MARFVGVMPVSTLALCHQPPSAKHVFFFVRNLDNGRTVAGTQDPTNNLATNSQENVHYYCPLVSAGLTSSSSAYYVFDTVVDACGV